MIRRAELKHLKKTSYFTVHAKFQFRNSHIRRCLYNQLITRDYTVHRIDNIQIINATEDINIFQIRDVS